MPLQSDQAVVQAYAQFFVRNCAACAVSCLVIYEFATTIVDEIRIVWKRPITASAVLLGSVRWCMLFLVPLQLAPSTQNDCKFVNILYGVLILVGFVQAALFAALRVFAICNRSYIWSLLVFALSMAPFATNMILFTTSKYGYAVEPLVGPACTQTAPYSVRLSSIFLYITRGSLILADTIVLVLTWIRTFGHWRQARHANIGVSVTTCLLRDGTVYFMTLLVANFIQMLTYNFPASVSPASVIVTALPPVLINRFMINLRTIDSEMPDYSLHIGDQQRRQATLQFRRPANRLGNIGETLQDGWSDELWDEENNTAEVDEEGRRETSTEDCTEV